MENFGSSFIIHCMLLFVTYANNILTRIVIFHLEWAANGETGKIEGMHRQKQSKMLHK